MVSFTSLQKRFSTTDECGFSRFYNVYYTVLDIVKKKEKNEAHILKALGKNAVLYNKK